MVVGPESKGHRVEVVDEGRAFVPYCIDCGWVGSDSRRREKAQEQAVNHERGEHELWQAVEIIPWSPENPVHRPSDQ